MALDTSLIEYWKCDESSGTNVAGSLSAYAGTLSGTSSWGAGKLSNAFTLSASGSFFKSTISSGLGGSFTVAGWVKFTNSGTEEFIFNSHVTSYDNYWFMVNRNTSNQIVGNLYDGTNNPNITTTTTVGSGVWTHIAFVRDTGTDTIIVYINGVSSASTNDTTTSTPTYGVFGIGEDRSGTDRNFAGSIDEMGLWSRALSESEVTELYNSGNGLNPVTLTTSLASYWKLDESSGDATDSVGSNTLTNTNTVAYAAAKVNNGADFGSSNTNKKLTNTGTGGINGGAISFSGWIKPSSLPSSDADPFATSTFSCMSQGNSSSSVFYALHLSNVSGTHRVYFSRFKNGVGSTGAYGNYTTPTSSFTHVAGTYDGTTLKVYVNGILQATTVTDSGTGSSGASFINIGNRNTVAFFSGIVDEVGMWSRALTDDEILKLHNSGRANAYSFTATPSLYGAVSYYKFDESSGNASDSISTNTLTNTGTSTYATAVINNGVTVNGSSQYLQAGSKILNTTSYSVSVWLKNGNASQNTDVTVFSNQTDAGNHGIMMSGSSTGNNYLIRCGDGAGNWQASSTFSISTSAFEHYVLVVNGTSRTLYRNGSSIISDTLGANTSFGSASNFTFGINPPVTAGRYWNGRLDEAALFLRALSSTEVTALYNNGSGNAYPFTTSTTFVPRVSWFD